LSYKTWGLVKTFTVKPSLGIKPEKEKEYLFMHVIVIEKYNSEKILDKASKKGR
jgi:hypothetical protein